jgi:hypothetical protein
VKVRLGIVCLVAALGLGFGGASGGSSRPGELVFVAGSGSGLYLAKTHTNSKPRFDVEPAEFVPTRRTGR